MQPFSRADRAWQTCRALALLPTDDNARAVQHPALPAVMTLCALLRQQLQRRQFRWRLLQQRCRRLSPGILLAVQASALLLSGAPAIAEPAWPAPRCQHLQQQREQVLAMQRQRSSAELTARERQLFELLARHCDRAAPSAGRDNRRFSPTERLEPAAASRRNPLPLMRAHNQVFQGEQAEAWTEFYQPPAKCRARQISEQDFVDCAEHKNAQRALFLQQWQQSTQPSAPAQNPAAAQQVASAGHAAQRNTTISLPPSGPDRASGLSEASRQSAANNQGAGRQPGVILFGCFIPKGMLELIGGSSLMLLLFGWIWLSRRR